MSIRILLVEDDLELAVLTAEYLTEFGFQVTHEQDGARAIARMEQLDPDLLILDLMLPNKSGIEICREVREQFTKPIIMLTARTDQVDQIVGLELGADDYICKPVEPRLLVARINAVTRRTQRHAEAGVATTGTSVVRLGDLCIDHQARQASFSGQLLDLSTQEYNMLYLLAQHAGEVLSREYIFQQVRGIEYDGLSRFVDITISRLRNKLGDSPGTPRRIKTIRNGGYLLVP